MVGEGMRSQKVKKKTIQMKFRTKCTCFYGCERGNTTLTEQDIINSEQKDPSDIVAK